MKVRRRPAVTLQIHHLDDGDETDFVLSHVGRAATSVGCEIERPSDQTNSVLIHCVFEEDDKERKLSGLLRRAEALISNLTRAEVEAVRAIDLEIALVVESDYWQVYLEAELLKVCGEKSISIRVVDIEKCMR
ncbi:MAG: hypothetical protein OMOMHJEC_00373 [Xanthomonadales bacterium]|nr:hypothetical protein [Xanthomonadales bacterium]